MGFSYEFLCKNSEHLTSSTRSELQSNKNCIISFFKYKIINCVWTQIGQDYFFETFKTLKDNENHKRGFHPRIFERGALHVSSFGEAVSMFQSRFASCFSDWLSFFVAWWSQTIPCNNKNVGPNHNSLYLALAVLSKSHNLSL